MDTKQNATSQIHEGEPAPAYTRLVILVPNTDLDDVRLARRIRSALGPLKTSILLLSLATAEEYEARARRRLTNLAAILREPLYPVTVKALTGRNWADKLTQLLLRSDLLVCFAGQKAPARGWKNQPVSQVLDGNIPCPLYTLDGEDIPETDGQRNPHIILGWAVSIAMILLFLGFDVRIVKDMHGWVGAVLLGMIMLVEAGLIWSWNSFWN